MSMSDWQRQLDESVEAEANEHAERVRLRDQFACAALTALGGHKAVTARGIPWLVEHAYMVADAMLSERDKPR